MFSTANEKSARRKKLNHSNSFRNQSGEPFSEAFSREDEARHSTGSMKGHYAISSKLRNDVSLKYPINNRCEERNMNGKRSGSNESQASDKEEQKTPSHSVSYLIKGFESKGESEPKHQAVLSDDNYTYTDGEPCTQNDKHKRSASKRKLSIRKRGKGHHDTNASVLQKLGIAPFMGSENRNPKKALSYFDVQSVLFDMNDAIALKIRYEDGGNRPKNISTGASAASIRGQRKQKAKGAEERQGKVVSRTDSIIDEGDGFSSELVQSCPYFRNETGAEEVNENQTNSVNKVFGKYHGDVSSRIWTSFGSKNRASSLELIPSTTDNDQDTFFSGSVKLNEIDQKKELSILEPVEANSKIVKWDNPKNDNHKRVFDFEFIDDGALYYREFFVGKEHLNYLGNDEKYGPVSISLIRESIEKMAVLGHNDTSKNRSHKYQYRIILRTTELRTFRGTVLEDSIPSTTRHGSSRPLPARDVLEFCFPDLQMSCLRLANAGPKVPEQLQRLDEQQLSLQYKVGLLYCKAGQNSEEDMYNNEHHGPAFDDFLDVIGERVLLKGFEGYRAQLDNKNDSTGVYSLYTRYHNREIMFHVSTLLPWTPNNKQQLLRKRHIGNDIVTVIFQEPGAEPFTPKNIRSHFQHVFIIVRVENPGTDHTTYKVAVSRSQDVPQFGPPIPPNSSFKSSKAFRDFLLSKICNAENAAHKSEKFTAMAIRTRFEYLKDLATNFVSATTIDSGGAKFSKFNPMSLSVKRKEKIHPPCNPEVWCQAALVWSVKVDLETAVHGSKCHMAISTMIIVLIDKSSKGILASIPCKTVIGWRTVGNSMKLYYNNGQGLNICLVDEDISEMAFVINRLKAVTPGCETQDLSLRRNAGGTLGFHVYYEGLVAEVEPYGMAWQAGLRKGSRLLEISNRFVSKMSHDRMIQALKKPGSIRVVVLPPLPDGQPRNYKSTRNLKRYSSMTSVYSERFQNSSDSSCSSSRENLAKDFDTITPIRVSSKGITTVEARMKERTPYSSAKGNQSRRPQGFILDSDQSLELTETGLTTENALTPANRAVNREAGNGSNAPAKVNAPLSAASQRKGPERIKSKIPLEKKDSGKPRDRYSAKIPLDSRTSPSSSSLGSVDPELTELERTITDTRKSIDAKFYKSLVQGSAMRRNIDRSNVRKAHKELEKGAGENMQESPIGSRRNSTKQRPNPPNYKALSLTVDKDESKRTVGKSVSGSQRELVDSRMSVENLRMSDSMINGVKNTPNGHLEDSNRKPSEGSPTNSTGNSKDRPSPPPYEEAISSLDRRRTKPKAKQTAVSEKDKVVYRHFDTPGRASSGTDSNKEDIPKHLMSTKERRRYRSLIKSENLDDIRVGVKGIVGETKLDDSRKGLDNFIVNKCKLTGAYSESNIVKSVDRDANGTTFDVGNIVQTRVRDVSDVIKEKNNHMRTGSADQLSTGFASLLPKASALRSSSIDASMRITDIAADSVESPFERTSDQKLPYKETTLGPVTKTVELYSPEDEHLTDTFEKIDQAFGFTSYGPSSEGTTQANSSDNEKQRRKSLKHRQRSQASKVFLESSDDSSSAASSSSARGRMPRKARGARTISTESVKRNKSEAEQSLEAAITEFHSTLSSLPDQNSSLDLLSSCETLPGDQTPVQRDLVNSTGGLASEETPKADRSALRPKAESRMTVVNRDYTPKITYTDRRRISVRSTGRQISQEPGSRVQELVGKFSSKPQSARKSSLDSWTPVRGKPETFRSRSEARISVLTSPSPWTKRDPSKQTSFFRISEADRDARRFERHWTSHQEEARNIGVLSDSSSSATPARKKISVTAIPTMSVEKKANTIGSLPVMPSWQDACERGMLSLPGRGKKTSKFTAKDFFDVPLTVRGLDLAPQRAQELEASSKEDLRLMLSVLSGELIKEKHENERLVEELEQAKIEKEQLLEQSQVAASQLRKFTSWFYDSVSKESLNADENQ
eukprot:gene17264-18988_t